MASIIAIRWILAILGLYACALLFASRTAMSVAIVSMTRPSGGGGSSRSSSPQSATSFSSSSSVIAYCASNENSSSSEADGSNRIGSSNTNLFYSRLLSAELFVRETNSKELPPEFDWNEKLQGAVLGASFYLYFIVPTFAGRLTDALGAKWITFSGLLVPCLLTALLPVAIRSVGVGAAIAIQTINGGFHGCLYPSLFSLYTSWFPAKERSTANALIIFGGSLGNAAMYILGGYLCATDIGWPLVFYSLSALHLPWLAAWLWYASSQPADNRRISDEELIYLKQNVAVKKSSSSRKISAPWCAILTSTAVWSSICSKMAAGFSYFMLTSKVPTFLSGVYGISIVQNGLFSSLSTCSPGISSLVAPWLSNILIERTGVRSIIIRKVFQSIALLGPALALTTITFIECNFSAAVGLIFAGLFAYGMLTGGEFSIIPSFSPNFSGTVVGFALLLPFSMGILAPYLVGAILDSSATGDSLVDKWNLIFYLTAGFLLFGTVIFNVFATDQQQSWDKIANVEEEEKEGDDEEKKNGKERRNSSVDSFTVAVNRK